MSKTNDNNLAALASWRAGTRRPTQQAATLDGGNSGVASGSGSMLHKDPSRVYSLVVEPENCPTNLE